jgi:hypothetical protein
VKGTPAERLALSFTEGLLRRDYTGAHNMLTRDGAVSTSLETLQANFEMVVPADWPLVGPLEVMETLTVWPEKKPEDIAWVYVAIGGELYGEAVAVVVTLEGDALKIRDAEFGRP